MPCVRYGELYTTYNTSFMETISFVSQELYEQCKQISNGDILITRAGPMNRTCVACVVKDM